MDFRKGIIAVILAILFTLFVFTTVDAFLQPIDWSVCEEYFDYNKSFDQNPELQECQDNLQEQRSQQDFIRFISSSIAGLLAVIVALFIPVKTGVGMSISSGILLGGLFTLFFGSITNFDSISTTLRPFVILIQIIVVLVVAYMKLQDVQPTVQKKSRKKKK
ncbi:MAG: hypothetical protein ACMXYA_01890 [Candidatus Woesearchaeota archaeon]